MALDIPQEELSPCSYATLEDMVKRFGCSELMCLADKSQPLQKENALDPGTQSYNRVICALNDAAAYLNTKLCCCFDAKQLCTWVKEGKKFPLLNFWQVTIARYYLYDVIKNVNGETETYRRFKQLLKDIEDFCDPKCCTVIVDETGECCLSKICKVGFVVAKRKESCIPEVCCKKCGCIKDNCVCASMNCSSSGNCDDDKHTINSYVGGKTA